MHIVHANKYDIGLISVTAKILGNDLQNGRQFKRNLGLIF